MSLLAFSFADTSNACSCVEKPSVEKDFSQKTAVFSGKVIKIVNASSRISQSSWDSKAVLFQVDTVWKGDLPSQVLIYTAISEPSCGYPFEINKEYIVYAGGEVEHLTTTICDRTDLLSNATEDINKLENGEQPSKVVHIEKNVVDQDNLIIFLPIAILGIVAIAVLFRGRG